MKSLEVKQNIFNGGGGLDWRDMHTVGFISIRNDEVSVLNTHPQGHGSMAKDGTGGGYRDAALEEWASGGGSQGPDLQKKPQLSFGVKRDLQSAWENKKLSVLSVGRGRERERATPWGDSSTRWTGQ